MKTLNYQAISSTEAYDQFLGDLYLRVGPQVEEVMIPALKILSVDGNQPPGSEQYQTAIACLYGIGYTLNMGLKHGQLDRPAGFFSYKVGALGSLWWSRDAQQFDIADPHTLKWKAYLIVPPFISPQLFEQAREMAAAKHPETPYQLVKLEELNEGSALQILHIGPYAAEAATVAKLDDYAAAHHLQMAGRHNELYISDPRRTQPDRLKTVIRHPVAHA